MLVSEMLERSVEESREKHAAVRSGCSTVNHTVILAACVMCVSVLVSEMLKRSVEESREKHAASGQGFTPRSTVRAGASIAPEHWLKYLLFGRYAGLFASDAWSENIAASSSVISKNAPDCGLFKQITC